MDQQTEVARMIRLDALKPFPGLPFALREDNQMQMIVESVRAIGVVVPALARPLEDGSYELISGHRRKRACELAGITVMPVIVRDVDREAATIMMVDSNLQREVILPSEKAKAYKMKLDAIKRQGARTDLTPVQPGQKLIGNVTSREQIASNSPDSATQIQRYIRLNELIPELLQMVDDGRIALTPAVELSYLTKEEQALLLMTIESEQTTPSLSQAQRLREHSRREELDEDKVLKIMLEQKKPDSWSLSFPMNKITQYFPASYTPKRMEETILHLLAAWKCRQDAKR